MVGAGVFEGKHKTVLHIRETSHWIQLLLLEQTTAARLKKSLEAAQSPSGAPSWWTITWNQVAKE